MDIDPPTEKAFAEASKLVREAYQNEGWIRKLFKEKSLIEKVLWDPYWDIWGESFAPDLFRPVLRINSLIQLPFTFINLFT